MAEYIEKQSALDAILREPPDAHYPSWYMAKIKMLPAADVVPVVHGRWIRLQHSGTIVCGNCGRNIRKNRGNDYADFEPYCPNCGCRMDLEG